MINDNELGYIEKKRRRTITKILISDQNNKTEYMVHYRMLKFYVKMGVKVTKFHRKLKFNKITYVETVFKTILIKSNSYN